jgi:hypothetical protein
MLKHLIHYKYVVTLHLGIHTNWSIQFQPSFYNGMQPVKLLICVFKIYQTRQICETDIQSVSWTWKDSGRKSRKRQTRGKGKRIDKRHSIVPKCTVVCVNKNPHTVGEIYKITHFYTSLSHDVMLNKNHLMLNGLAQTLRTFIGEWSQQRQDSKTQTTILLFLAEQDSWNRLCIGAQFWERLYIMVRTVWCTQATHRT